MDSARGFTLVEVMVSLVVVSLIAVLVTSQIRTETMALRRASQLADELDHLIVSSSTPSHLLRSAYPLTIEDGASQEVLFEGDANRVVFATLSHAPPIDSGISVYALSIERFEGERVLRIARSSLEAYLDTGDPEADGFVSEVAAVPDGFRFVYADPAVGQGSSVAWVDEWTDIPFLPAGVAMCVLCQDEVPAFAVALPARVPVCLRAEDGEICRLEFEP